MDIQKIREDFPILSRTVYGKPLVYFDNGATTQKPRLVVDALVDEYYSVNANVHRGVHYLSQQATELHEASRETVRQFINAGSTNEVVFTRGTTESINLLVSSFGDEFMQEGDEVILSVMEHHSNIVPWQLLAARKGIAIKVIPMNDMQDFGNILAVENVFAYKQVLPLHEGDNLIGRRCKGNDIDIPIESNDPSLDRRHCYINVKKNKQGKIIYTLRDNDSITGTFLMNEILGPKDQIRIEDGAIITLGATTLILRAAEGQTEE